MRGKFLEVGSKSRVTAEEELVDAEEVEVVPVVVEDEVKEIEEIELVVKS